MKRKGIISFGIAVVEAIALIVTNLPNSNPENVIVNNIQVGGQSVDLTKDDVQEMVDKNKKLSEENLDYESRIEEYKTQTTELKSQNEQLKSDLSTSVSNSEDYIKENEVLKEEILNYKSKIKELDETVTELSAVKAELSQPDIVVHGESISTTITDYVAKIEGYIYYREDLLNTFLAEKLSLSNGKILYGEEKPEKVNVVSSVAMHDNHCFDVYNGGEPFYVGGKEYKNGIVNNSWDSAIIYIECGGDYSNFAFTLGHVDNTGYTKRKLEIYYMSKEGEYKSIYSKDISPDIPVEKITLPIYNTQTIKIVISSSTDYTKYALANMYLAK